MLISEFYNKSQSDLVTLYDNPQSYETNSNYQWSKSQFIGKKTT